MSVQYKILINFDLYSIIQILYISGYFQGLYISRISSHFPFNISQVAAIANIFLILAKYFIFHEFSLYQ